MVLIVMQKTCKQNWLNFVVAESKPFSMSEIKLQFSYKVNAGSAFGSDTWVVSVVGEGHLLPLHGVQQRGDQTLTGIEVQRHQLWQRLKPLGLHALRRLRTKKDVQKNVMTTINQPMATNSSVWIYGGLHCSTAMLCKQVQSSRLKISQTRKSTFDKHYRAGKVNEFFHRASKITQHWERQGDRQLPRSCRGLRALGSGADLTAVEHEAQTDCCWCVRAHDQELCANKSISACQLEQMH